MYTVTVIIHVDELEAALGAVRKAAEIVESSSCIIVDSSIKDEGVYSLEITFDYAEALWYAGRWFERLCENSVKLKP